MQRLIVLVVIVVILNFSIFPMQVQSNEDINDEVQRISINNILKLKKANDKFKKDFRPAYKMPVTVKGIYVTGPTMHRQQRQEELVSFIGNSEINSLVIDFKDDEGRLSTSVSNAIVSEIDPYIHKGTDFKQEIINLSNKNIYLIARIVVFKDPFLAKAKPEWSIRKQDGSIWYDRKGISWVDPHNEDVWKYTVELAKEAAKLGFREIQFDYVRFPTDGNMKNIVYPFSKGESKKEVIYNFLKYAKEELEPYNVFTSADVFGLTTSTKDDMKIGQQFEMISDVVDYICPMVYPSHYAKGSYGISDPNKAPYETVYEGLLDGVEKVQGKKVIIRPWLQDFSLGVSYGPEEIIKQKNAVYDSGLNQWMFWNARNRYTESAFN